MPTRRNHPYQALGDVVLGFRSLNNFRLKPRLKSRRVQFTSSVTGYHYLAPDDFDLATGLGSVDVSRLVNAWVSPVMSDSPDN